MRRILSVLCLYFAATLPCYAQADKPKPNTLTPKEIADGWILLFDGETTFGWKIQEPDGAHRYGSELPKVENGEMRMTPLEPAWMRFGTLFPSFEMAFEYKYKFKNGGAVPQIFLIDRGPKNGTYGYGLVTEKEWTRFSVGVRDGDVTLNGQPLPYSKFRAPALRSFGFAYGDGSVFELRDIKLHPLDMKPLFNGADLTGWKEFPGKKSKFAVSDGAINVKDGPGDLQTVGKYKDFILQLECKSNGKHLNSGIFFRCRNNEYQNGYEAQIRNQFTKEAEQKYLIEEFDPKTNKLIGKKEQFFTAVDYGTGAIYRRQPARKQMSKDGEWFGMTVVAHGNHLATWVNGVQVTDWYDNRPKSDNARTGCKLDAGHISIQGHDPTTDLSFRNIRIAEFK